MIEPGGKLGKYELRGTLGRGAMGVVYDGWDPIIARRVAIKTVRLPNSDDSEGQEELARFRREAQAAGRLTHPNIVGVYDYGEDQGVAYIVMEFVDGPTLKSLLDKQERMALPDIVRVMEQVLTGLAFSHARGIVHRDIKPANVMLTSDGQAKIADFGIARIESSSMTQAGTVMGTPAYMSPEQFMGQTVDARTDIYSSGVLLYQLLTGERPFDGGFTAIMHKVLNTEPPKPSDLSVTAPPALDAVVQRAMAKRPEGRWSNADNFAQALRQALTAPAMPAEPSAESTMISTMVAAPSRAAPPPPPVAPPAAVATAAPDPSAPRKGSPVVPIAAGVVVLAALGGGAWFMLREAPTPQVAAPAPPAVSAPATPGPPPTVAAAPAVVPPPATPTSDQAATAPPPALQPAPAPQVAVAPAPQPAPPPALQSAPAPQAALTPAPQPAPPPALQPAPAPTPQAALPSAPQPAPAPVQVQPAPSTPAPAVAAPAPVQPVPQQQAAAPAPTPQPAAPAPQPRTEPPQPQPQASAPAPRPSTAVPAPIQVTPTPPAALQPVPPASVEQTAPARPEQAKPSSPAAQPTPQPAPLPPTVAPPAATPPAAVARPQPTPAPPPQALALGPVTPPPPPSQPQPAALPSAAAIRAALAAAVPTVSCSLVSGSVGADRVTVRGVVGEGAPERALVETVNRAAAPYQRDWRVNAFNGPFCAALDALRPAAQPFGTPGTIGVALAGNATRLRDGDLITVVVNGPDFAAYVYVSFLVHDGTLAHLHPTPTDPARLLPAGGALRLGDPAIGGPAWAVSAPFGTDLVIAVASSVPLFEKPRPDDEDTAAYLRDLRGALDAARRRGARLAADAWVLETAAR